MSWKETILKHLDQDFTEPVRDPIWQNIHLSPGLKAITTHESFQKLGRIKQLGPAFHVYPGATHTRLAHSFGVLMISRRILRQLLASDECIELSPESVRGFLCACLLHDLGHFPYAHSLKELPLKEHEALTGELILSDPLKSMLTNKAGADPETVAAIIDLSMSEGKSKEIPFFRNILSGVLDPDKLDYLTRDAFFCGVPYGMQDIDFIVSRIVPHPESGLAIEEQGVTAVENLLFSKYLMYRTVYWHKTVRIATAMIKKAVLMGMRAGAVVPTDLYGIDDEQFSRLFSKLYTVAAGLVDRVTHRNLYKMIFETNFDGSEQLHLKLTNVQSRLQFEQHLAKRLSKLCGMEVAEEQVIIDIPEPISFEVDLPILTGEGFVPFPKSGSVFTGPVVQGFTRALRKLRLIVAPEVYGPLCRTDPGELLGLS